jgi:hypothetical protein
MCWSTTWFEKPELARGQLTESLNQLKTDLLAQIPASSTPRLAIANTQSSVAPLVTHFPTVQDGIYASVSLDKCDGDFYISVSNLKITEQLQKIISSESPVLEEVVFEKIARAWGLGRTGSAIRDRLRKLTPKTIQRCYEQDNLFLCAEGLDFSNYSLFRGCNDNIEGSQRNINELCSREIYAGVSYFKKRNPHESDEEIAYSVCRYVGMKRVTDISKGKVLDFIRNRLDS